jgi:CBS domain-containing protein
MIVMTVRDVMTRQLVTIGPETPCDKALCLMAEHRIRHLPVVDAGRLVGMVSDRDLRSARVEAAGVAARIMTADPATVTSATRVEHAARLMLDGGMGSLPVVDGGALAGIVTYTDLLHAFVRVIETATEERIAVDFAGLR